MLKILLVRLVLVVGSAVAVGLVGIVGWERIRCLRTDLKGRLLTNLPGLSLLVGVLLINNVLRRIGPDVSWIIGWEVTGLIYGTEGEFVVWLQSFSTPQLTIFFSYVYIYGYVFLLVFPLLAYLALENSRPLRMTLLAFAINYWIGLVCYLLIIAYGPRNILPDIIEPLLYSTFPEYQHLTRQVNRNTNVFPSLHTALAMTVAFIAYRTREEYPCWAPLAIVLAICIAVSTMYLGIHWAMDVVAGVVLAAISVVLAERITEYHLRRTGPIRSLTKRVKQISPCWPK